MKLTLLQMVQDILNDLDSDTVNSIDDTVEAGQVAQIIKTCYNEMMNNRNWPHQRKLIQFDVVGTLAKPNYIITPENVKELELFQYDKRKADDSRFLYSEIIYKEPDEFLRFISTRNGSDINTQTIVDFSGTSLLIRKDIAPTYWTSFDDTYIVTDSYDSAVDSTIKKSKTQFLAYCIDDWVHQDSAIPTMPAEAFPALLEEAKSTAFFVLKQMANQKAEQKVGRQQRWLSRKAWRTAGGVRYEDYGRKGRK